MAFWSTPLGNSDGSAADPKRKFRFTVEFPGLLGSTARVQALQGASKIEGGIVWFAKSVSKPAMTISEADHTFLDKKFYFPGRVEWSTVTLTLVDPADPTKTEDAVKQMNQIIEASGYKMYKGPRDLKTMSKSKAASALGNVVINQIDSEGKEIETWTMNNCFIKDMKFGDLDYTGDELVELQMEIRYDWATCDVGGRQFNGTQA